MSGKAMRRVLMKKSAHVENKLSKKFEAKPPVVKTKKEQ